MERTTPIYQKCALTIEEAADYSNIGQNKISELLKTRDVLLSCMSAEKS